MTVIECGHCGASVSVGDPTAIRSGHNVSSGKPREWVMFERGDEVHRCTDSV
jgi:hypothetical protein